MSLEATNLVWAGSPHRAEHEPARLGSESEAVADLSAENHFQGEDSRMADASANYANLPIDRSHANFAAACIADVTPSTSGALAAATNWAEQMEAAESGEDSFTVVKHKRRRRESPNRPVEQRSSGVAASKRTGATPRRRPTAGGATVVQEIRATRADIADARVQQRSSTEDNCVFVEHCPDFGYTHYLQAVEELVGGAGNVLQVMKMDGHMLVGLSTKALAERLLRDGLEIGHTHLRAFPFKKRAERITVANLPFFVDDAAVIEALKPYGDVSSNAPIRLRAGRYTFTDGRREVFILLKEGFTLEKIPTRVVIRNKGNVLSAFISYGVKCSRCGRQGHRKANCPINPGRASNNGQPQPAPLPPGASSTVSRQQSRPTPAAPALPMEETPSAPPPVTPAPPLQAPEGPVGPRPAGSQHPEPPPARPDLVSPFGPLPAQKTLGPAAPTPDVEMSIVEETFASSTSSAKNATRVDLDAFIEGHPSVSFAETDALGLGREEVLDLLSSRTKAQRKGPLLSPPQCDALAGLIRQILDLRPGAASNLYKVFGQVKAELRTTPTAASPTPPLPAPRPAEPTPPAPHGKMTTPALATSPLFQVEEDLTSKRWDEAADIIYKLCNERYSGPLTDLGITEGDITDAVIYPEDREPLLRTCSTQKKNLITEIISAAIERARDSDLFVQSSVRESLDEDQVLLLRKLNEVPFSFMEVAYETPQYKILSIVLVKPNKENYKDPKAYRPISLSSNLGKIFESLIHIELLNHINSNNVMHPAQHGFTQEKSTISALQEITKLSLLKRETENTAIVTVDISGAFDNAWHPAILQQLDKANFPAYQIILWAVRAYKTTSSNCVHSLAKIPLLTDYIESRIIKYDLAHLSTEDLIAYEPHAPSIVKSFLHAKMKEIFDNTNEIFRSFFVSGIPRFFRPNFYNIQFITDHGNFGKFLSTIGAVKEPGCFCGAEEKYANLEGITDMECLQKGEELLNNLFPDDKCEDDTNIHKSIRNYNLKLLNKEKPMVMITEVNDLIDKLNPKKSPGIDNISNNMIRHTKQFIAPILVKLFQKCLDIQYYPAEWKRAEAIIIPKPGKTDFNNYKNYRPLCLNSNISKIFEKIINNRIIKYYEDFNLLSDRQHGFRRSKSTITALTEIIKIALEHKTREYAAIIAVDISAAFDNAWWPALMKRLDEDGVQASMIKLLQSYFDNRRIQYNIIGLYTYTCTSPQTY
ncbi:hypothetical protein LAZ67_3001786 [Cordylochernes scorpioides]|uniref:Reverse transcriptase domain-containing protein n=1 Tax=Cordylochernes scorpioides TaxID=51811 RepID=A0ABY6K8Y4_9ARAC|nr:hypothetical protein LAZ67_3001786 [Cordylochernes scorpioides]